MSVGLVILAFILMLIGLVGAVVPVLPGPPIGYAGLIVMHLSGKEEKVFSVPFLVTWGIIVAAVTVMDYIFPSMLAKKFGGSRAASIGSFLGLIAGLLIFPPWGFIIGSFLGALIGELIHNRQDKKRAFTVALGAFLAFLVGAGAKLIVGGFILSFGIKAVKAAVIGSP